MLAWPPPYLITKHPRAKHVKIKASVHKGLEFVVPMRFSVKHIPELLETHKAWILKKLAVIQDKLTSIEQQTLPDIITLNALNETWKVFYIPSDSQKIKLHLRPQHELILLGNIDDKAACQKALLKWIKKKAHAALALRLKTLSIGTDLPYNDHMTRTHRARWGSCSHDKNISLNFKLIFLPTALADHVIVHELCHTIHMDHSSDFWDLVTRFDPQCKTHKAALKQGDTWIPAWVEAHFI